MKTVKEKIERICENDKLHDCEKARKIKALLKGRINKLEDLNNAFLPFDVMTKLIANKVVSFYDCESYDEDGISEHKFLTTSMVETLMYHDIIKYSDITSGYKNDMRIIRAALRKEGATVYNMLCSSVVDDNLNDLIDTLRNRDLKDLNKDSVFMICLKSETDGICPLNYAIETNSNILNLLDYPADVDVFTQKTWENITDIKYLKHIPNKVFERIIKRNLKSKGQISDLFIELFTLNKKKRDELPEEFVFDMWKYICTKDPTAIKNVKKEILDKMNLQGLVTNNPEVILYLDEGYKNYSDLYVLALLNLYKHEDIYGDYSTKIRLVLKGNEDIYSKVNKVFEKTGCTPEYLSDIMDIYLDIKKRFGSIENKKNKKKKK